MRVPSVFRVQQGRLRELTIEGMAAAKIAPARATQNDFG
jgi:hypothetical protein